MTFTKKTTLLLIFMLTIMTGSIFADTPELKISETFYDNGQLMVQYTYYECCLSGDDPCSQIEWRKHGDYTYWAKEGQKRYTDIFQDDVKVRKTEWSYFIKDEVMSDQVSGRTEYKVTNDVKIKDGISIRWYENGDLYFNEEYKDGVLTKIEHYFENGDIQTKGEYINGVKHGEWVETSIYSSGTDKTHIETWQGRYETGIKQGVWEMYYEYAYANISKYLKIKGSYLDGIQHDEWIEWYPDLGMKYQGSYKNGNKDGLWNWWGDDGNLYTSGRYDNGLKTGTWTWNRYDDTFFSIDMYGQYGPHAYPIIELFDASIYLDLRSKTSKIQAEYKDDLLDGQCLMWFSGGGKSAEGSFKKGLIRHGAWTAWNESGSKYAEALFKNGVEVSRKKWRYETTPSYYLHYYQEFAYEKAHGTYFSWNSKGENSSKGQFSNGQLCGSWYLWVKPYDESIAPYWDDGKYHGPCGPVMPDVIPSDPEAKTIKGWVMDDKTDQALSGTKIQVGDKSFTTDSTGVYHLVLEGTTDKTTLTCTKTDYADHREKIDFSTIQHKIANIRLKKIAEKPVITSVSSKYGNIFLKGISLNNEYSASVFWKGQDPGQLKFDKNGTAELVPGNQDGGLKTYDMGSDFNAAFSTTANKLSISALIENEESDPVVFSPIVIPVPDWSVSLGSFGNIEYGEGMASYSMEYTWPDPPFEMQINQKTLGSALWNAWGLFPLVGGRVFGIIETQATIGMQANTLGYGHVKIAGQTGFAAAGQEIIGNAQGTGLLKYMSGKGLQWTGAEFILGINGTIKKEVGPISLIPALENAENWWLIGKPIKWFNSKAVIKGQIDAGAEVKLIMIVSDKDELVFDKAQGQVMSGITLGLAINICKGLSASMEGGAKVTIYLIVPANPNYLEKIEATLFANLQLVVLGYEKNWEGEHTFPDSANKGAQAQSVDTTGFKPVSRRFLNQGSYNHLVANTMSSNRSALSSRSAQATIPGSGEFKIIENIYPHSSPVIAQKDGRFMIVYVYTDPKDPVLQSMEIYYTYYDGSSYSAPMPIQDDTRSEFNPSVAYDDNGNIIAVWERVKNENFDGELEDMVKELEIVWAVFKDGSWSTPLPITDNIYIDHAPLLAQSHDNKILLVWRGNTDNEFMGSVEKPDTLYYAKWNGTSFSTPAILDAAVSDGFKFSLAYNGTNAVLAYTKDMDGDFSTRDEKLFYYTFDGTNWTPSNALVTDTGWTDINPKVIYTKTGTPELVWLKQKHTPAANTDEEDLVEGKLVRLTDWANGTCETIREGSSSVTFTDFQLFAGSSQGQVENRLVLIWQDIGDNSNIDLFYSVYDDVNKVWSKDLRLTDDKEVEKGINGSFGSDDGLHLVFNKVIGDGTYKNQTLKNDLYYLNYHLKTDLAVSPENLTVSPEPKPGEQVTLTALVENKGDLAQQNITLAFYEGDPDNGGLLIETALVSSILKAGDQKEVSVQWTLPENGHKTGITVIVDPEKTIAETDTTNNIARFYPVKMNLELIRCSADVLPNGDIEVFSVIKNNGFFTAEDYGITYKADGEELVTHAGYAIQPGNAAEVSHIIIPSLEIPSIEPVLMVSIGPDDRVKPGQYLEASISLNLLRSLQSAVLSLKIISAQNSADAQYIDSIDDQEIGLTEAVHFLQESVKE